MEASACCTQPQGPSGAGLPLRPLTQIRPRSTLRFAYVHIINLCPMNWMLRLSFCLVLNMGAHQVATAQEFAFHYSTDFPKVLTQTQDSLNPLHFAKLLSRFSVNDTSLTDFDILALLIGFTPDREFRPYAYLSTERKIYALNGSGEYRQALATCDSFLVHVPVSQTALIEKAYAFHKLGMPDSASYYGWRHYRIMQAMGRTGDGLTPETAIFSLGPTDGQNYIVKYLGGDIETMGSGTDKNGNFVDILHYTADDTPKDAQSVAMYFQIQHAVDRMFNDEDRKRMQALDKPKSK
jgi:hypothetical protein